MEQFMKALSPFELEYVVSKIYILQTSTNLLKLTTINVCH